MKKHWTSERVCYSFPKYELSLLVVLENPGDGLQCYTAFDIRLLIIDVFLPPKMDVSVALSWCES